MTYDHKNMQVAPTPKEGDRLEAAVVAIDEGVLGDFIKPEYLEKWDNANETDPAIQVTVQASNGNITKHRVFKYPADGMAPPRSNLAKWNRLYQGFPHVGQRVELIADSDGYYDVLL